MGHEYQASMRRTERRLFLQTVGRLGRGWKEARKERKWKIAAGAHMGRGAERFKQPPLTVNDERETVNAATIFRQL